MKLDAQFTFNVVWPYMFGKMVNGLSCQMKSIAVTLLPSWGIDVLCIFLYTLEKNISKFMGLMNHTVNRPFYFYDVHIYLCRYASKNTKKSASCSFCRYLSFLLAEYTTEIRFSVHYCIHYDNTPFLWKAATSNQWKHNGRNKIM